MYLWKLVKPQRGDDGFDARVERGGEQAVVAAERVADAADAVGVDFGERLQQVDRADVVVDRLHRAADVVVGIEVVFVFAERWIVGRERDVAALGELERVVQRGAIGEADGGVFAVGGGLVEAEDGGTLFGRFDSWATAARRGRAWLGRRCDRRACGGCSRLPCALRRFGHRAAQAFSDVATAPSLLPCRR